MATLYQTRDGDMLDHICWKHYKRESEAVEIVLLANPELASYGSFLPAGLKITLPDLPIATIKPTLKLWD